MKFLLLQRIIYSFSLPKYNIRGIFIFLVPIAATILPRRKMERNNAHFKSEILL